MVDATGLKTKELSDRLRDLMLAGTGRMIVKNACGQRYIGTRLYRPGQASLQIEIFGTPGNDLGAFLSGHRILVHGNVRTVWETPWIEARSWWRAGPVTYWACQCEAAGYSCVTAWVTGPPCI